MSIDESTDTERWAFELESPFVAGEGTEGEASGIPAGELIEQERWRGTPAQHAFRRRVLAAHVARMRRRRRVPRALPPGRARALPGSPVRLEAEAAEQAGELLAAANRAIAQARRRPRSGVGTLVRVTAQSGHRSPRQQARLWRAHFPRHYNRTERARRRLPGGPHSAAAVRYMLDVYRLPARIAAPGYSRHHGGRAIDIKQVHRGAPMRNSTNPRAVARWRGGWFHRWMGRNARRFGFEPLTAEPWHFEYRGSGAPESESWTEFEAEWDHPGREWEGEDTEGEDTEYEDFEEFAGEDTKLEGPDLEDRVGAEETEAVEAEAYESFEDTGEYEETGEYQDAGEYEGGPYEGSEAYGEEPGEAFEYESFGAAVPAESYDEYEFEDQEFEGGDFEDQEFEDQEFEGEEFEDPDGEAGTGTDRATRRLGEFLLESAVADRAATERPAPAEFEDEDEDRTGEYEDEYQPGEYEDESGVGFEEFGGAEHKAIGDAGTKTARTALVYGARSTPLTFGDVVALAGDMYGSYYDLSERSRDAKGRTELAWARWKAIEDTAEPPAKKAMQDEIINRYWVLAAENISHFSAGGTAAQTYMKWHTDAMSSAFAAGQANSEPQWRIAVGKEAFADHFLTDSFAAGHVRTPRADMKAWYRQLGDTTGPFVRYMAAFMVQRLRAQGQLPLLARILEGLTRRAIAERIRTVGGEALQSFSLGDVVSLALHDFDNCGLFVVSKADPSGRRPAGGYRWQAVGDGHLKPGKALRADDICRTVRGMKAVNSAAAAETTRMATAAVVASFRDLERVRAAGREAAGKTLTAPQQTAAIKAALGSALFPALDFVPREDRARNTTHLTSTSGRASLEWRWGQLGPAAYRAVDASVKGRIAKELADRASSIPDPARGGGMTIHGTRPAFHAFVQHLRTDGIKALERAVGKRPR